MIYMPTARGADEPARRAHCVDVLRVIVLYR
jgi:hypothetical protein